MMHEEFEQKLVEFTTSSHHLCVFYFRSKFERSWRKLDTCTEHIGVVNGEGHKVIFLFNNPEMILWRVDARYYEITNFRSTVDTPYKNMLGTIENILI